MSMMDSQSTPVPVAAARGPFFFGGCGGRSPQGSAISATATTASASASSMALPLPFPMSTTTADPSLAATPGPARAGALKLRAGPRGHRGKQKHVRFNVSGLGCPTPVPIMGGARRPSLAAVTMTSILGAAASTSPGPGYGHEAAMDLGFDTPLAPGNNPPFAFDRAAAAAATPGPQMPRAPQQQQQQQHHHPRGRTQGMGGSRRLRRCWNVSPADPKNPGVFVLDPNASKLLMRRRQRQHKIRQQRQHQQSNERIHQPRAVNH